MTSSCIQIHALPPLPRLPATHVERPRLSHRLLDNPCRLTLINAPAGFGKSVLLGECARQQVGRVLWLDLLGQTLSPDELLARLAGALGQPAGEGDALEQLTLLLGLRGQGLLIVLDDYPRQGCAELDACLERLLERGPHNLRWWISGRRRPDWNLPRLLLQGDLEELDAHDLALDAEELDRLLHKRQIQLSPELQEQLLWHTEGWLAGLCLLLMQGGAEHLGERLHKASPLLQEYLQREVLEDLPEELREALLVLGHLPRCNAELCGELLGDPQLLERLQARQLFLRRLDPGSQWLRLWRPLAGALRQRPLPIPAAKLHLDACRWFAARGCLRDAVEHALAAEQPDVAANYLQQYGQDQLLIGHSVAQFLQWRSELPASLFTSTPRLIALQAWALIMCARLDEADQCVQHLARYLPQPDARRQRQLLAQYQAIRGVLERQRGLRSGRQHCLEALELLPESAWSQRMLCQQALAQQAMGELDLHAAQQHCLAALQNARQQGSLLYEALLNVDYVHLLGLLGELPRALQVSEDSLQRMREANLSGPVAARLWLLKGQLLLALEQGEAAEAALRQGLQEAEQCQDAYLLFGYVGLAELAGERGEHGEAQQLLHRAERQMQWLHVPEVRYRQVLNLAQGQLALAHGHAARAGELFAEVIAALGSGQLAPSGFYDLLPRARLLQARALIAGGQRAAAEEALGELQVDCQARALRRLALAAERAQQGQEPTRASTNLLSSREQRVLRLIAEGLSNQQIAEQLFISLHTVKTHARRINVKLGVVRRTQAVAQAKTRGWLE